MNKYFIEFLGTMFLMFIILATGNYLAIGAALAILYFLNREGAFNPAVAIAYMHNGKLPSSELFPYIIAHIVGALAAVELLKLFLNNNV